MAEPAVIVPGTCSGPALVLDEPLSLWGGLDPTTGTIIDQHHPQAGATVRGSVLVLSLGRGSSGGSSVLAEAVRSGNGPVGVVLAAPDPILVVGGVVIAELYPGRAIPMVVAPAAIFDSITTGDHLTVQSDGTVTVGSQSL